MDSKKRYRFGKAEHLKSRKQIEKLFAKGNSFFVHPFKMLWQIADSNKEEVPVEQQLTGVKMGVTASTRNFKKAVDRNHIKRLMREAYRLNKYELVEITESKQLSLTIFFIYVDKTLPTFDLVQEKMKACLSRLIKEIK